MLLALSKLKSPFLFCQVHSEAFGLCDRGRSLYSHKIMEMEEDGMCRYAVFRNVQRHCTDLTFRIHASVDLSLIHI